MHHDLPFTQKHIFPGDQGHPFPVTEYRAPKWSWWAFRDIPEDLILAYDSIRSSGALDEAMKRRIEDDFFRSSVTFVKGFEPQLGNMDPSLLRGMIVAGRVLSEPDYIHEAVDWIDRIVDSQFFADGMWREGIAELPSANPGRTAPPDRTLEGIQRPARLPLFAGRHAL